MLGNTGSHLNCLFLQAVTSLGLSCEALPTLWAVVPIVLLYFSFVVLFWLLGLPGYAGAPVAPSSVT